MIGTAVTHYKIVERLGGGGMGVVYKAEDLSLKRTVALKFLPPELLRDHDAKERFRREAQAASGIDHPNVCTIYEIDETEDGRLFIAMAFYEGETLRAKIERGPLPISEAVDYARQAAIGLEAAHEKSILHRDVKPANLFVTRDGQVKILDFGLAKVVDEAALTGSGTLGTPTYMSPEQIGGEPDPRSDLWSLGVVLYEMLTGRRPFPGTGPAAFFGVLHQTPPPLRKARPGAPVWVQDVVDRTLAKDPEKRYRSAAELAADLDTSGSETGDLAAVSASRPRVRRVRSRRRWTALAAVLVLAAAIAWILARASRRSTDAGSDSTAPVSVLGDAVAVLPFSYRGNPNSSYLGEGMVDLLSAKLDGTGSLRAVDPRAILSHLASESIETGDPRQAARLAERFNADQVLLGNIVEVSGQIHIDASLYTVMEGAPSEAAKATAEGGAGDLFSLVDSVAAQLLVARLGVADDEMAQLASLTTDSFAALRSYLEGESAFRAGRIRPAAEALERAVAEDPQFALAWYRLGHVNEFFFETAAAQRAAAEAARLSDRLSDRHRLLVEALNLASHDDAAEADRLFRQILRRYPTSVEGWYGWAELLFHCGPLLGRPLAEAKEAWQKMFSLEPGNAVAALHLARIAFADRDLPELTRLTDRMVEILGRDDQKEVLLFRAAISGEDDDEERLQEALREDEATSVRWLLATGLPYAKTRDDLDAVTRRVSLLLAPSRSVAEQAFGHRVLAILDVARGRIKEARQGFETAGALFPAFQGELEPLVVTLPFFSAGSDEVEALRGSLAHAAPAEESAAEGLTPHAPLAPHLRAYQLGLLSALSGDDAGARRQASRLEGLSSGDSDLACLGGDLARGVRAAGLWRHGRAEATLAELANRQCQCNYQTALATPLVSQVRERYLRAEALYALERFNEALPWYASLSETGVFDVVYLAPAHRRLGEIYRRQGNADSAREHLTRFVELWEGGDEELRPLVGAARRQLAEVAVRR